MKGRRSLSGFGKLQSRMSGDVHIFIKNVNNFISKCTHISYLRNFIKKAISLKYTLRIFISPNSLLVFPLNTCALFLESVYM